MKTKSKTPLRKVGTQDEDTEKDRLSIAACRKILKEEGQELSDDNLLKIRDYFYGLAAITMEEYQCQKTKQATVINLKHYKTNGDEESHYLRAG